MRLMVISALALATALLLLQTSTADAQPETIFIYPEDGAVLAEPPPIIRMCFDSPANIQDLNDGGDFRFNVITPESRGLGLRIVFHPDGRSVDVHLGIPEEPPAGEWTFEWRVTDAKTIEPSEGILHFMVEPDIGSPVPEEPPKTCAEALTPEAEPTPDISVEESEGDDDDGTDTVILVVAIVGAVVGVAALGSVLFYFIRRRSQ